MKNIGEYEDRARRHGIEVSFFQSLQTLTTRVDNYIGIDVGFSTSKGNVICNILSSTRHNKIKDRLYVFGRNSEHIADIIKKDDSLSSLLIFILDNYAFSVELSDSRLTARVNMMLGFPSKDGTGGERFFSALSGIAAGLRVAESPLPDERYLSKRSWGPAQARKLTAVGAGLLPLLVVALMFVWLVHRSPSLLSR